MTRRRCFVAALAAPPASPEPEAERIDRWGDKGPCGFVHPGGTPCLIERYKHPNVVAIGHRWKPTPPASPEPERCACGHVHPASPDPRKMPCVECDCWSQPAPEPDLEAWLAMQSHSLSFPPHPDGMSVSSATCTCGWSWDADSAATLDRAACTRDWQQHVRSEVTAPSPQPAEALRDALLDDLTVLPPNLRRPLTIDQPRAVVAERLDAIIAAARATPPLTVEYQRLRDAVRRRDVDEALRALAARIWRDVGFSGESWKFCSNWSDLCWVPHGQDSSSALLCANGVANTSANDKGSSIKVSSVGGGADCWLEVRDDRNFGGGRWRTWDPVNVSSWVPWPNDQSSSIRRVCT